jgi:hypothetical protein
MGASLLLAHSRPHLVRPKDGQVVGRGWIGIEDQEQAVFALPPENFGKLWLQIPAN